MDWTDDAIVLSARRHGETSAVVTLLTANHGRYAGLARGAMGGRGRGVYQAGNRVRARWRARLAEHLGTVSCELLHTTAAGVMDDPLRLAALASLCAMAAAALPEREPHPAVYEGLLAVLGALGGPAWPGIYVRWELGLLGELGFGLDLGSCAVTGRAEGLAWVSPKSGRAVSAEAGAPYGDRLLRLPPFLLDGRAGEEAEVVDGLALAGFFLDHHLFAPHGRALPPARQRFVDRFRRYAISGVNEGD